MVLSPPNEPQELTALRAAAQGQETLGRQSVVTANRRVLERLLAEVARFESGETSLPNLQAAILGHGLAAELGDEWQDLVNRVEGELEIAKFTLPSEEQVAAIKPHLNRLRDAARRAIDAEPSQ